MALIVRRMVMMAIVAVALLAPSITTINAYDPSPLQNICVADNNASVHVNGKVCKDPKLVTADDFVYSGLQIAGDTNNPIGFGFKMITVNQLPSLNTLGISVLRFDFAANGGVGAPHLHPRASEVLVLLEGTLYVGFVDSTPGTKSKLYSKILKAGDVFVFPVGLMHFQQNVGNTSASCIVALNSQDPGFVRIAGDVFGTNQSIPSELLAKSFQLDKKEVEHLQSLAWNLS